MTSLLREFIILILVSRIIPVILDESRALKERKKSSRSNISKFFSKETTEDRVVFQPQRQNGCVQALKKLQRRVRTDNTIDFRGMEAFHLNTLDCNQQRCKNIPLKELCASNEEDKTNLRIFNNICLQCAEGCEQVKNGKRPFTEMKKATIFNGKCYKHSPVMVRKEPDTVLCSRPSSVRGCGRINCSSDLQDLPHLPNIPECPMDQTA